MLAEVLVKTFHRSSAFLMSPLNKPQKLQLITVAPALPLPLPLALTASITPHSSRKLFTKLKKLQPISVALTLLLLIPLVVTGLCPRFSSSSYQKAIQTVPKSLLGSPDFGSNGALKTTPIGLRPNLCCKESHIKRYPYTNPRLPPHSIATSLLCRTIV